MSVLSRDALLDAARRASRRGISAKQAIVIGFSELTGSPLDPDDFDDSAVILRAERLLLDGFSVSDAVRTARSEFITWNRSHA